MEYLENLLFIVKHSAYTIPAAAILLALGFLYGCCNLAKFSQQLQAAEDETKELEGRLAGNLPEVEKSEQVLTEPSSGQPTSTVQAEQNDDVANVAVSSALIGLGALGAKFVGEESDLVTDEKLGLLYGTVPANPDDLTLLDGISEATASVLNEAGVYKYKQLEVLNADQRGHFESRFDLSNIDWSDWGVQLDWKSSAGLVGLGEVIKKSQEQEGA